MAQRSTNPNRHVVLETLKELEADTPGTIRDSYFCPQFLIGRAVIDYRKPFASALIVRGRLTRVWGNFAVAMFIARGCHAEEQVQKALAAATKGGDDK